MIDKNDVKMPVYRDIPRDLVPNVEALLEMLSEVDNKQELRLKSDYYAKFHWFGGSASGVTSAANAGKSYFSYQEEAVYDFIFNLNKSGILSDQVGMGKTIEAGMIISELASRNELRSLLIIVPNEIMAEKWEYELEEKFGIKEQQDDGRIYPKVTALKNYTEFCKCVFDCVAESQFKELAKYKYPHTYDPKTDGDKDLSTIVRRYIDADIHKTLEIINKNLQSSDGKPLTVTFDGKAFAIKGTDFKQEYVYDQAGAISDFLKLWTKMPIESLLKHLGFSTQYRLLIQQELTALRIMLGNYFTTVPTEISTLADSMTRRYPFLVIPISYSDHSGDQVVTHEFLNRTLIPSIQSYKHKYITQTKQGEIHEAYEDYRIVDFFIDVGYQTLIVDEVHDYIDVCAKIERDKFHKNVNYDSFSSDKYNRYELFDDYYFIRKESLYKKLKSLADKANRKIFLTATPIKSDMVDFYLLTLLASNKDADVYRKISENLEIAFPSIDEREKNIAALYDVFKQCIDNQEQNVAKHFCDFSDTFLATEQGTDESGKPVGRFRYPYFNNSFIRFNRGNARLIREYLLSQISYMSMEEIILELIIAYNAENTSRNSNDLDIRGIMQNLFVLFAMAEGDDRFLRTRVVFRALFDNSIKTRFEEDFTTSDGQPIKRIRKLLENDDGARKWNRTYRKYGIRHTRHQTYNLAGCPELTKLSKNRVERYQNLPVWPKRDGNVIFLVRDDIFFDCYQRVERIAPTAQKVNIKMTDLPNYDRLKGTEEEKAERFKSATAIFDYINNSMSGGDPETHEPLSSRYESVDLDDAGMVDYKLVLINKLLTGSDTNLGEVKNKVLLFAENDREAIKEWFIYHGCEPLRKSDQKLDEKKLAAYKDKWQSYTIGDTIDTIRETWHISEDAADLSKYNDNLLLIVDPKRYEKGVDLQKADTIINFDINYCPLKMEQRIGRIDRIRPNQNVSSIKIISFVPMNDMSGYVINFFANELKMFTQWMGETTGIVSVPEDEVEAAGGEDVSFEGKVYNLEVHYHDLYTLCKENVDAKKIEEMVARFVKSFNTNKYRTEADLKFLAQLRPYFDTAFRNSVSPQRMGYPVAGSTSRVMRFNSARGAFVDCASDTCANCSAKNSCSKPAPGLPMRNIYNEFHNAAEKFFKDGEAFYQNAHNDYSNRQNREKLNSSVYKEVITYTAQRKEAFRKGYEAIKNSWPKVAGNGSLTMPFKNYDVIMSTMKQLYWDAVVNTYLSLIINKFHEQCNSVLLGAELFERFVKTLSIADFMNNMEGTV